MNKKKLLLIGYILACIIVVLSFTQVLISVKITSAPKDPNSVYALLGKSSVSYEATALRGYESAFFIPALVCCIIGTISCIVKYKRGLVTAMGMVTVFDLLAMAYMSAFTKDFLLDKFMIGYVLDPKSLKAAGITIESSLGLCFYLGIIACVLLATFTILTFIFVPADEY